MERQVAIKKLGKILGKSLGYRVDLKAPVEDDRIEARAELKVAVAERDALSKQKDARMAELLQADAEFQRLKVATAQARKRCEELQGITMRYRFTAGTSNGLFFAIKAQGDSWEEVIGKLTEKQSA